MRIENNVKYVCPRCKSWIRNEELIPCTFTKFEDSLFKCIDCSEIIHYNELIIKKC
jgi:DNA-directed RNA polymerase subunit RPC12/RpoP